MAKIKKRKKSQSTPDQEFRSIAGGVVDFYREHQKPFNTVLTVLVVAFLGWLLFSAISARNEAKAGKLFEAAYSFYAPEGGGTPDYQRALMGFEEVVKQYGGTLNGAVSQYYAGNSLEGLGKMQDAIKAYKSFADRYSGRTFLMVLVYQRMGYAYLADGDRDEAVKAFKKAEELGGVGPATMELARLYEKAGNVAEAQNMYREITEKLPATTLATEAREKLPPPDLKVPAKAENASGK